MDKYPNLPYKYLILDLNGTLALDGKLIKGVSNRLIRIKNTYQIYILTADMHGNAKSVIDELDIELVIINQGEENRSKGSFIAKLGPEQVISIGAGANDVAMLKTAALGIAVLGPEGLSSPALLASDIITSSITEALDLLINPNRIIATLRT